MDGARHFKAGVPVGAVLRSPYLYVCLSVCLLACLRNACPSFLHVLPAAVAWSSSNDNTIDRIKWRHSNIWSLRCGASCWTRRS